MEDQNPGGDELPSLLTRSHISTPIYSHDVRFNNRNSEDVHNDALAAAQAEHDRVREVALRAVQLNELRESSLRLQAHARQEAERIKVERERALEEIRIRELENKARQILRPPLRVPTPPPVKLPGRIPSPRTFPAPQTQAPSPIMKTAPAQIHRISSAVESAPQTSPTPSSNTRGLIQAATPSRITAPPRTMQSPAPQPRQVRPPQPAADPSKNRLVSHVLPDGGRYTSIHKSLKDLRKYVADLGKQNSAFKKKTGEMRRAIRQSVGQLIGEKGANKIPVKRHPYIFPYLV